jgi:hypothetical protein
MIWVNRKGVQEKALSKATFLLSKAEDWIVRKDGPDNRGNGNVNDHGLETLKI